LIVQNELLRQQVHDLSVSRQRNSAGFVYRETNLVSCDFSRASSKIYASLAIDAPHVRAGNTYGGALDGRGCGIFRLLYRLLDCCYRFIQLDDDPFS
jgi:hypothetical protein